MSDHPESRVEELVNEASNAVFAELNEDFLNALSTEQLYTLRQVVRLAATKGIALGTVETAMVLGKEMQRIFSGEAYFDEGNN